MGGSLTPPHSVINADDFETPQHLAEYLLYLDKHPEEHIKYLEWKNDYIVDIMDEAKMCCKLCEKIHESGVHWYEELEEWSSKIKEKIHATGTTIR